ncbi:protein phosphatase 2C domain-containing protein [Thiocapsa sp.]|uniref:PP2C family protein-serine/threonine phosphatase n=1 Tax=Thiocapsa sp. TaxID=2024551 RepID=UPI00345A7ADD
MSESLPPTRRQARDDPADRAAATPAAEPSPIVPVLRPGNAQWIGTRPEQQDAFAFEGCDARGVTASSTVLVVLADGMGGLQAGREASRLAVTTFRSSFAARPPERPVAEALDTALQAANRAVHALARTTAGEGEVGTTLVAAAVCEARLFWVGVGDSRLYLYRGADRSLTPCTEDHNLARELQAQVDVGALDPAAVAEHPDRNALTSFLGLAEVPLVDRNRRPLTLHTGDRLLLCSDGVDGVLDRAALAAPLAGDPQAAADALIAALRASGQAHQDNATVAVLACELATALEVASVPLRRSRRPRVIAVSLMLGLVLVLGAGAAAWFGLDWWQARSDARQTASTSPIAPQPDEVGSVEAGAPEESGAVPPEPMPSDPSGVVPPPVEPGRDAPAASDAPVATLPESE